MAGLIALVMKSARSLARASASAAEAMSLKLDLSCPNALITNRPE